MTDLLNCHPPIRSLIFKNPKIKKLSVYMREEEQNTPPENITVDQKLATESVLKLFFHIIPVARSAL